MDVLFEDVLPTPCVEGHRISFWNQEPKRRSLKRFPLHNYGERLLLVKL